MGLATPMSLPIEPLNESAPLALDMAARACRVDPATGERCDWSHGLWQFLRVFRLVGSIEYHTTFYRDALALVDAVHGGARPRVLISGASDYGVLARVLWAFRGREMEPDITVVDLCETPLELNRWYAARERCEITTVAADITAFRSARPFDAICADSFLGRFAPDARAALAKRWHALLRPGGTALVINRLRADADGAARHQAYGGDLVVGERRLAGDQARALQVLDADAVLFAHDVRDAVVALVRVRVGDQLGLDDRLAALGLETLDALVVTSRQV